MLLFGNNTIKSWKSAILFWISKKNFRKNSCMMPPHLYGGESGGLYRGTAQGEGIPPSKISNSSETTKFILK
jgi:hypothetical protein